MAACLMKGIEPVKLDWQSVATEDFKNKKIDHEKYSVLNKALKAGYPEAWYYWLNTVEVLAMVKKESEKKIITAAITKEEIKKEEKNKNVDLTFIVNGKEVIIENVNPNEPLKAPVEQALDKSGNSARPLTDWLVKYNDQDLDISIKVGDFNFPKDAKIFISLKSGVGGGK
ncbi:MAG: DUF2604 domain-containing protein [Bacteroidetes bacterium]|nr:DUF2604 domain-containing protein [Bacteroidota bacterium]